MEFLYERYKRLTSRLPRGLRWLALVFAPAGTSLTVLVAGLVTVAAGLAITVGIGRITFGGTTSAGVVGMLIIAFLAESLGYVVKERQELLLVVMVRQLTYRRFLGAFASSFSSSKVREHVLTYPGQISQFAYVVDAVVSTIQIIAFLAISLALYGAAGAFSVLLIIGLVLINVQLITLIGRLWEQYIDLEGRRRRWIQRVVETLPRGWFISGWGDALSRIIGIRRAEEELLHKRVVLQVLNGFLDRGALTVTLAAVAILGVWLWPETNFGLGIILAARYLYGAVQNVLVNYRVIRLAVPMMRELDSLEMLRAPQPAQNQAKEDGCEGVEVLAATSARAEALRSAVPSPWFAYVPPNPQISHAVLKAWRDCATYEELSRFTRLASHMGLSEEVIRRFWQDSNTLSSGERHRAALALVLTENPDWLILDDTFAALDPITRDVVARLVLAHVPACTLLMSSEEYVPTIFVDDVDEDLSECATQAQAAEVDDSGIDTQSNLPDPLPKRATFRRSVNLLFGSHVVWIVLGALLLAGSEVSFALTVADSEVLTSQTAYAAGACGLGAVIGTLIFFGPLYRVPIARLSKLHERLISRLDEFARPRSSGVVVGRVGEDFSDLQMSVPGALGAVFIVIAKTLLLIAGAVAGAPLFAVVVLAAAPLAFLAMRQGEKWIRPAATMAANRRGEYLGAVGAQAGLHAVPISPRLRRAGEVAYDKCETLYLVASLRQANAYALRSALIQSLTLLLNISAVLLVAALEGSNPLIAPAAVLFFAVTLSSGVQSTVETLQEVGVLGLTTERVRLLEDFRVEHTYPQVRIRDLKKVEDALGSGCLSVALIGATGAGKSVMLDALCRKFPEGEVALIPDVDPFAPEETDLSGLALARAELCGGNARLILLDETMKTLTPQQERVELETLADALKCGGKQAVVVLHSRSNLDCFTTVVDLDE